MKSIFTAALLAASLAAPALGFAQAAPSAGRAVALTQMQQLADAGYRGHGDETTYPADVEAAQQRVDPRTSGASVDTSGYGAAPGTHSESGARERKGPGSLYFGV